MISKATKQKLDCFDDPMKLLPKWKKAKSRGKTTNTSDTAKPVLDEDHLEKGEKGVIRVKVVLTKEEAARLLSMCIRGEEKTLEQLMSQLESRHASAVTPGSSHGGWRPVLESIPEDY